MAATFLLFCPIFFAQSGLFQLAVPLAAMTTVTLYAYFDYIQDRRPMWFYLIAGSLLVLVKESAVLVILVIVIFNLTTNLKNFFKREMMVKTCLLALPLLIFGIWLIGNKLAFGWFLWPYNVNYFTLKSSEETAGIGFILASFFSHDYRFLISILIFIAGVLSLFIKRVKTCIFRKELLSFFALTLVAIIFFWWGPFLPRYLLFIYPLFFIVGAASLAALIRNKLLLLIISLLIVSLFISRWVTDQLVWGGETRLDYIRAIEVHQQMAEYIEFRWSDYKIITVWPMSSELQFPPLGYVSKPLDVFLLEDEEKIKERGEALLLTNEIFYGDEFSKKLKLLSETQDLELIKQLAVEGEELLLYFTKNVEEIMPHLQ